MLHAVLLDFPEILKDPTAGVGGGASGGFRDIVMQLAGDLKHVPSDYIFVLCSSRGKMGAHFHVRDRNVWPQRHGPTVHVVPFKQAHVVDVNRHQTGPINTWPARRGEASFLCALGAALKCASEPPHLNMEKLNLNLEKYVPVCHGKTESK